jgi:hypothetical protein
MVDFMKNLISFFLSVVLLAFPIVFAQQESDAAGVTSTSSVLDIVGAVVAVAVVAAAVASSKSDSCHTC